MFVIPFHLLSSLTLLGPTFTSLSLFQSKDQGTVHRYRFHLFFWSEPGSLDSVSRRGSRDAHGKVRPCSDLRQQTGRETHGLVDTRRDMPLCKETLRAGKPFARTEPISFLLSAFRSNSSQTSGTNNSTVRGSRRGSRSCCEGINSLQAQPGPSENKGHGYLLHGHMMLGTMGGLCSAS